MKDKKKIKKISEKIIDDLLQWLEGFSKVAPKNVKERELSCHGINFIFKNIIGLFIKPQYGEEKYLYVFQGLRNKKYMSVFSPNCVMVIGSKLERKFAKEHGYRFCWSFPIINAVNSSLYQGKNFFIYKQISLWIGILPRFKKVIFFLYEDTQTLGCFFAHVSRSCGHVSKTVCIQHGYFDKYNMGLRHEGARCNFNFLWDINQADLIGCSREYSYEVGLPYSAIAKPTSELIFILVGIGEYNYGTENYEKSLGVFNDISIAISREFNCKIFYRPHPNEWKHRDLVIDLRKKFTILDELNKEERMNGPQAIFIGTISSLLFEAQRAGHYVSQVELFDRQILTFKQDYSFKPEDVLCFIDWISYIQKNKLLRNNKLLSATANNPTESFVRALQFAKIDAVIA